MTGSRLTDISDWPVDIARPAILNVAVVAGHDQQVHTFAAQQPD